jgi:hypothetical protein
MGVSSMGSGIRLSIEGSFPAPSAVPGATVYLRDRLLGVWYDVDGNVAAAGLGGVMGFGADARASSGSPKSSKSNS